MAGRVVLAAFISAVLVFVWGFLYWGVFNVGGKIMKPIPDDMHSIVDFKKMIPTSGMYVFPFPQDMFDQQGQALFKAKHESGPILRLTYQAKGGPVMSTMTLVKGFVLDFVIALLAAGMVAMAGIGLPRFDNRFCFVMLISLFATIWANVGDVIWWHHTTAYCLGNIAYFLGSGFLMGMIIGSLVKPAISATESTAEATS